MKLGILGAGQLAKMLALSAYPLGIDVVCFSESHDVCAAQVSDIVVGQLSDHNALLPFIQSVDCITLETENIPIKALDYCLSQTASVRPGHDSLAISQDRLKEKTFFNTHEIKTAPFVQIDSKTDLINAVDTIGLPAILKTRFSGYDGKGQFMIKTSVDIDKAWEALQGNLLILEGFVQFDFECSIIAVRNKHNEKAFYPLARNKHVDAILSLSEAGQCSVELQQLAENYAAKVLETLDHIGVLTIEFFCGGNTLIANEMAPRVHNSGHWTIEGANTSQFENHVRALFDLPLGSTRAMPYVCMQNCIGKMPDIHSILTIEGAHYHDYGKAPGEKRKLGHVTLVCDDHARYIDSQSKLLAYFESNDATASL